MEIKIETPFATDSDNTDNDDQSYIFCITPEQLISSSSHLQLFYIEVLAEGLLQMLSDEDSRISLTAFDESSFVPGLVEELPLSKIKPFRLAIRPSNSEIEQLAISIREKGLLQPILVRPIENGYFEVITGNRRFNACKLLHWKKILCHIVDLDDKSAYEVSLIENIQRKSMDPVEEALAFKKYVQDYGWASLKDLAKNIGKSSSYVSKRIALLELPQDVLEKVRTKEISPTTAEELLRLDSADDQSELATLVSRRHLSMRKAREMIKDAREICFTENSKLTQNDTSASREQFERALDKAALSLQISLSRLGSIIESTADNWIIHEILLQHKAMLHSQIDLLLKEKRKSRNHRIKDSLFLMASSI